MSDKNDVKEITREGIESTMDVFEFESKNIKEKKSFILDMFGVNTINSEITKPKNWVAELILERINEEEPCEDCFGLGCQKCYGTGQKRE